GLETTIAAAAKKAKLTNYKLIEYPKPASFIEKLFGIDNMNMTETKIKNDLGIEYYNIYKQLNRVKQISDGPQARLPFEFTFN
ncbi:MAG TPA: signal peptide peptidase SppA, partial [Niabella sp.]|nr:signal peptide peptidase SppA [Niabella sp.]